MRLLPIKLSILFLSLALFAAEEPKWVKEAEKVCKKHQICAVGQAEGRKLAEVDARAGIAKVFETKIKSKYTQTMSETNGDVSQSMMEEIVEEVNQSIEGIKLEDSYQGKLDYFVFAVLNKKRAAKGFRTKIKGLDEKMKVLLKDGSAKSVRQASKMFKIRERLNYRLEFVAGSGIPSKVSYGEVFKKKKESTKNVKLFVKIDENEPKEVEALMITLLSEMGYKIISGDSKKATHTIEGKFVAEKQFLNVEGFEKYKFLLQIIAKNNKNGDKSGSLDHTVIRMGRDFMQCLENALPMIRDYLNENLSNLNIE